MWIVGFTCIKIIEQRAKGISIPKLHIKPESSTHNDRMFLLNKEDLVSQRGGTSNDIKINTFPLNSGLEGEFLIVICVDSINRSRRESSRVYEEAKLKLREKLRKNRIQNKNGSNTHFHDIEGMNRSRSHQMVDHNGENVGHFQPQNKEELRLPRFQKPLNNFQSQLSLKYKNIQSLSNKKQKPSNDFRSIESQESSQNKKLRQAHFELK